MSIELPVATRHRRDMTEKLLKATLNPNTHTHTLYTVKLRTLDKVFLIILKLDQYCFTIEEQFQKMQTKRQTVDPDQTGVAVRSGSTLPRSVRPKALDHYRK